VIVETRKISVIVVSFNGRRFLHDCLEALSRQTYPHYEIIFVDNGSADSSVLFVRESYPGIKIVELSENRGFAGGNAAGLKVAEGDLIALLNNDARPEAKWLENLVVPMLHDPKVGICASKLLLDDGTDKINSAGDGVTTAGVGFNRGLGQEAACYGSSDLVFGACAAAVLYRRRMLDEVGFLDEDFFLYDEDTDLNFRAQLAGWKCVYVHDAVVRHKLNATSGRMSDVSVYYHTRNLEFVWIKNMPGRLMLRFAHHKLIQEIGAFIYVCIQHKKYRPFFKAKRDALRLMGKTWDKRREIQRQRRVPIFYVKEILTPVFAGELIRQKIRQLFHG
jgi:GT2 family glycosyltransferase